MYKIINLYVTNYLSDSVMDEENPSADEKNPNADEKNPTADGNGVTDTLDVGTGTVPLPSAYLIGMLVPVVLRALGGC